MTYYQDWLYLSDASGCPQEIINGARLTNNLANSNLCGYRFSSPLNNDGCDGLLYAPGVPAALSDAVFWIDAADAQPNYAVDGTPNDQYARNRGTGGPLLNAIYGATTTGSAPSDEPLSLNGVDRYLYTPAVSGNNASVPNTAVLRCSTDFEILIRCAMDNWQTGAAQTLVSKFTAGSDGYEVLLSGLQLRLVMRIGGADVTAINLTPPYTIAAPGQGLWLRISRVSATGIVTFYTAPDEDNVPTTNWSQLGATVASTAGAVTTGNTNFFMGERPNNTQSTAVKLFRVIVRNVAAASTPVNDADFDFTLNTSQSSFVATAGGTVTINRSATGRKSVAYMGRPLWLFGTDDFMTIPDNDILDFAASDSFTVVAVTRRHAFTASQVIVSKGTTPVSSTGWFLWVNAGAVNQFGIFDGAASSAVLPANPALSTLSVIAGVRNGSTRVLTGYGTGGGGTVTANDTTTASLANAVATRIGGDGTRFLDSEVVAVMIWRRALTATEIAAVQTFYQTSLAPASASNYISVDLTAQTSNPWYNASSAASREALGFIIEEWTGLDGQNQNRASFPTGQRQGGAFFGQQTQNMRTMKLNILLHGSSERGLNYLFRWLESTLLNACGPSCGARQLWLRQFCPASPSTDPTEGVLRAERVVLIEGLQWEAPPVADAACFLRRASFTLACGDPCLYRDSVQLTPPTASTIAGVTITPTATATVAANCATWAGSNRRVQIDVPQPEYGSSAPVVTISSPMSTYTIAGVTARATLPVLRITGYSDPLGYGDPCRATKIGELILEGVSMAGLTIYVDLAQRKVTYDDPYAGISGQDGSGFIGAQIVSGVGRWFTFDTCTSGFVVVEPAYATLDTVRSVGVTSGLRLVSGWTTTIGYASRAGCA